MKALAAVKQPFCGAQSHEMIVFTLFNSVLILGLQLLCLLDTLITGLHALAGCPGCSFKETLSLCFPILDTFLHSAEFSFQLGIFNLEVPLFDLYFVGVLDCCVNQFESCIWTVAFLFDDSDIFSQAPLSIFQLLLKPFDFLIL